MSLMQTGLWLSHIKTNSQPSPVPTNIHVCYYESLLLLISMGYLVNKKYKNSLSRDPVPKEYLKIKSASPS